MAIPVERPEDFQHISGLVRYLIFPLGRMYYLTVHTDIGIQIDQEEKIEEVLAPIKEEGIFAQKVLFRAESFEKIIFPALQCLTSSFCPQCRAVHCK
ncbi:hypothetical protein [Ammoniphilus sp. 3BR4]|uniref:hypothetical protein n=1 Tax=Ammoniphilus sp. 3BR4 TaxID=3158265 RepID=UPI0034679982